MRKAGLTTLTLLGLSYASSAPSQEAMQKDCYFAIDGLRVMDGPCRVNKAPSRDLGNSFDLQFITTDQRNQVQWFVNLRVTDFSTTISWNGSKGEPKDLISLGNTLRKPDSDPTLPEKCRANNRAEVCLWEKGERPLSMKNLKNSLISEGYHFSWNDAVPHYNVNINCEQISANTSRLRECVNKEQENFDLIKEYWYKFDDSTKQECSHRANIRPWQNYQVLSSCLVEKIDAEEAAKPVPRFRE